MNIKTTVTQHWFYCLLPLWLAAAWAFRSDFPWQTDPGLGEAITLIDWCVLVPTMFVICYWGMSPKALALRVLALICGGIWLAGKIVPVGSQIILQEWSGVRWIGLTILALFELGVLVATLRIVYGSPPDPQALEEQGIPPFIARLIIAEARFWRRVCNLLRGHK